MSVVSFFGENEGNGDNAECDNITVWPLADAARDAFFVNLVDIGTETFDGFSVACFAPPLNVAANFANGVTATVTSAAGFVADASCGLCAFGRFPVSSPRYIEGQAGFFGDDQMRVTFSEPVAAFGFYGVDVGDFAGQLGLTTNGTVPLTIEVPATINGPGGSVMYFGFYVTDPDEAFTEILFTNTAPGTDFFAFDNMSVGLLSQIALDPVLDTVAVDCAAETLILTGSNFDPGMDLTVTGPDGPVAFTVISLTETEAVLGNLDPAYRNGEYCVTAANPGHDPIDPICATLFCPGSPGCVVPDEPAATGSTGCIPTL